MALSGSFSTSIETSGMLDNRYPRNIVVTWNASQDIANNTSTISWRVQTGSGTNSAYWVIVRNIQVSINGTVIYSETSSGGTKCYPNQTLASGTMSPIGHNTDGTKSISVSASAAFYYSGAANSSYSGTITLDQIPRTSSFWLNKSNVGLGDTITVNINRASSSFRHNVRIWVANSFNEYYVLNGNIESSTTFTIPTSWYLKSGGATTIRGRCRVDTYINGTYIGQPPDQEFTITIPDNVGPTIGSFTLTPQEINGYAGLVQHKNKLNINVSGCTGGYGTSVTYTINGTDISQQTSPNVTVGPFYADGTKSFTLTITDEGNRSATITKNIECIKYDSPKFTSFTAYRVASESDTTPDGSGTYVRCLFDLDYSSVENTNNVTVRIHYKPTKDAQYKSIPVISNETVKSGVYVLSSIDVSSMYSVYASISDKYNGSNNSDSVTIFSAERILNITKDGKGIAIGKMADTSELLDVRWPIKTDAPEQTMQNLSYKGFDPTDDVEQDTTRYWNNQGNLATAMYTPNGGKINGKPSDYGLLLNLCTGPGGAEAHQLWMEQPNGNIFHRGGNNSGISTTWKTLLDSSNYGNYTAQRPTVLYGSASGTFNTINMNYSAADYEYIEIYYVDNNGRDAQSIRINSPNNKTIDITTIETGATDNADVRMYIRASRWTISGKVMTPGRSLLTLISSNGTIEVTDVNQDAYNSYYIKVFLVLGYK